LKDEIQVTEEKNTAVPRFIFVGDLRRDYAILPSGRPLVDVPGGSVLYAAAGLAIWEPDPPPGVIARVGEDYPQEWIEMFRRRGLDTRGIKILPEAVDLRSFYIYIDRMTRLCDDALGHFNRLGLAFPRSLLGYQNRKNANDSRTQLSPISLRQGDIHPEFLDATAVHICPLDYLSHNVLPAVMRQAGFTIVTLDPSPGYMNPVFWNDLQALFSGLTAILPSEEEVRALFHGRSSDLWEMAEALAKYGCEMVVIKRGESGQLLYDASSKTKYEIPAYPSKTTDPTGAGDSFCGGFLAGYRKTFDPLQAVLHGNISSSLTLEGSGPFYALDVLPGLAQARLETLAQSVRKV
jgi:sugar/nucleoside kinase (ribokinase family)